MVQANVMPSYRTGALPPRAFPGSIRPARADTPAPAWRSAAFMVTAQAHSNADDQRRCAWMAAAQAGDRIAYEMLLRDCVPFIRGVARRTGVAPDRLDDVVQDVLLTIHRARQTYDPARSFDAWLRVIASRRSIDALRRSRRQGAREIHAPFAFEAHADETADPAAGLDHEDTAGRIGEALSTLPQRQREAVQRLVLEERSLAEAAVLTRRSKGSLKVNLHRALKALRLRVERGD